jgi:hypothetical protein
MAKQPVDLFQVALGMDPRFGENLPKDVADAFASGDVARVFRTGSATHSPATRGPSAKTDLTPSRRANIHGEHSGSIYVQTHSGRTARWKLPEIARTLDDGSTDAAWNANHGAGSFFDNAMGVHLDDPDVLNQYLNREVANQRSWSYW